MILKDYDSVAAKRFVLTGWLQHETLCAVGSREETNVRTVAPSVVLHSRNVLTLFLGFPSAKCVVYQSTNKNTKLKVEKTPKIKQKCVINKVKVSIIAHKCKKQESIVPILFPSTTLKNYCSYKINTKYEKINSFNSFFGWIESDWKLTTDRETELRLRHSKRLIKRPRERENCALQCLNTLSSN